VSLSAKFRRLFSKRSIIETDLQIRKRVRIAQGERWTIRYSANNGDRIDAYLLVPTMTGRDRVAAIIASHQHNGQYEIGKSEPAGLIGNPHQAYGLELCAKGYAVLCPDHLGFEARQQKGNSIQFPLVGRAFEQFVFGDAILRGGSLAATYLFDLQQAISVLESFDFIDSSRIGAIGHSLGGQTALWLGAMDPRVKVTFASCGFSLVRTIQDRQIPHNCALYLPGFLEVGDMDDVVASIAPRAFGMSHGLSDKSFPMLGVRKIHARATATFSKENLLKLAFRGGHEFPPQIRERAYRFIDTHLRDCLKPWIRRIG